MLHILGHFFSSDCQFSLRATYLDVILGCFSVYWQASVHKSTRYKWILYFR